VDPEIVFELLRIAYRDGVQAGRTAEAEGDTDVPGAEDSPAWRLAQLFVQKTL
jgi:hypothetical protein